MNVLLVDDQANVVSSLKTGINWTALSIQNIYTALSSLEAKQIISRHSIDILLTDIEMPVENGLSLLRWCRKEGYDFECIFLTTQADFFYAQEAIQLGSFDYLLQPARYEDVERAIQKSINRIKEQKLKKNWLDYGKVAFSHKNILLKGILDDWFYGKNVDDANIIKSLNDMNIPVFDNSDVYLFWIQIHKWRNLPLAVDEWNSSAEEIIKSIFQTDHLGVLSYCPDKVSMATLVYSNQTSIMPFEIYQTRINSVFTQISRRLSCSCAIYTAPSVRLSELTDMAKNIQLERKDNILQTSGMFISNQKSLQQEILHCDLELLQQFELYMVNRQAVKAEREALFYLQKLKHDNHLNHDTLLAFCRDYQQSAYHAARELKLFAHSLPSFEDMLLSSENTSLTLEAVAAYIKQLTTFFNSALTESETVDDSFSKIENYIQNNLDRPLLCSEIAKAVYLSPDYITRLFQREKGVSLKEYITHAKMLAAKKLLITTSLPISLVAVKVGYDNFSHFSKVYRKVMGATPSSERNELERQE